MNIGIGIAFVLLWGGSTIVVALGCSNDSYIYSEFCILFLFRSNNSQYNDNYPTLTTKSLWTPSTTDRSNTADVGTELFTNPLVRKISFTGSTAVGKLLMKQSSDTMKRLSLELGGNAPFVVFEDADLDQAVASAMVSKFRNAGQTCVCADRFLVHSSIHDEFVKRLVEKVKGLVVGPGMDATTTMGPLILADAVERTHEKVQLAIHQDGATCVVGGTPLPALGPQFYAPTILTNVSNKDSLIWKTETFGPVVAIMTFDTEEEALEIANDCDVGLASYFCTNDLSRAFRFSERCVLSFCCLCRLFGILSTFLILRVHS